MGTCDNCLKEGDDVVCRSCSGAEKHQALDQAARAAIGYIVLGDHKAAEHELRFATSPDYARENKKNKPKRATLSNSVAQEEDT